MNWYLAGNAAYSKAWRLNADARTERLAYRHNAYVVTGGNNGYHPGQNVKWTGMSAFTTVVVADVSGMEVAEGTRGVIECIGGVAMFSNAFVLYKNADGSVELVQCRSGKEIANSEKITIPAGQITPGYHLFAITYEETTTMTMTITLSVDGGQPLAMAGSQRPTTSTTTSIGTGGFQIGALWNGAMPAPYAVGAGMAVYSVLGWGNALSGDEIRAVYEAYEPVFATPIPFDDSRSFNNGFADGILYVPSAEGEGTLRSSLGTVEIPAGETVSLASLDFGVTGNGSYELNVLGTLNVTSTSTVYNVRSEVADRKGIIFGRNGAGVGAENVLGTLRAPDSWLEVNYSHASEVMTIDGGTVTVRGVYAPNVNGGSSNASLVLKNGGVLEAAEFHLTGAWPRPMSVIIPSAMSFALSETIKTALR